MVNIYEILQRAASLKEETALNSISPERAGGIMYDTLLALNDLWLQQGSALVISKIYASVAAMEADTTPVSDLTGKPLRPGQIVVIASSDSDNGSVYRYNGTDAPSWSLVGAIGSIPPVDSLDSDSTTLPLAAHQGKVLDGKIGQLGQGVEDLQRNVFGFFKLEKGGISDITGEETISGSRARSGYITRPFVISVNSGYLLLYLFRYVINKDGTFTFDSTIQQSSDVITISNTQIQVRDNNNRYAYRVTARPNPDRQISDIDAVLKDFRLLDVNTEKISELADTIIPEIQSSITIATKETIGNILIQNWSNQALDGRVTEHRLLSPLLPVQQFTNYLLYFAGDGYSVEIVSYDHNGVMVSETPYKNSDYKFNSGAASYVRAYIKNAQDDAAILSVNTFVPIYIYPIDDIVENNYYPNAANYWEYGSIDSTTGTDFLNTVSRARTKYLQIKSPSRLIITPASGYAVSIYMMSADKTLQYRVDYITSQTEVKVMPNIAYYRLLVNANPDSRAQLDLSAVAANGTIIASVYYGKESESPLKIRVAEWNMGLLNNGVSSEGWGIPNAELDATIPALKKVLTDINADIFCICEYSEYLDRNKTLPTYDNLLSQFYKYHYFAADSKCAIMSKYPMNVTKYTDAGRVYIIGNFVIDGQVRNLMVVHFSPYSVSERLTDIQNILTMIGDGKYIIAGDFNIGNNAESDSEINEQLALFVNAGFVIGNYGYWGALPTADNMALDNIAIKGGKIATFNVNEEKSVSDHYPIVADIFLY